MSSPPPTIEMSEKQELESTHPETAAALHSALNNASAEVKQEAMLHSADFSLKASPSVNLYLNTQKQKKQGKPQRPQMDSLFNRGLLNIPEAEGRDVDNETSVDGTTPQLPQHRNQGPAGTVYSAALADAEKKVKFGMFEGVFARCLLNIWGVIMFLRMGWMVGHAGAGLATSVSLSPYSNTTLSISISTKT